MSKTLAPQPSLMSIWRALLVCATFLPAFVCSLFLRPGSTAWGIATGLWAAVFVGCYLWYLPRRFASLTLRVEENRFVLTTGVVRRVTRTMHFENIQFVSLRSSPLHRHYRLASVVMVAPGGRMVMPGLREEDARRLAGTFFYREKEDGA